MNKGMVYAAGAYIAWGLLPIYWKALHAVPALEILAQRIAWSMLTVALIVVTTGRRRIVAEAVRNWRQYSIFAVSALLLSLNWLIFIWGVNAGFIIETSLGYFINPLVNVVLGMLFLRERLRIGQAFAILIALSGVVYLTVSYGRLPWIALMLAGTFGLYGLLRKTASLPSLEGLTLESMVLFLPAVGYLVFLHANGQGSLGRVGITETVLLVLCGVVTTVPLLLFASGARMLPLTTLGILQYIAPTLQLLIGVEIFHEPLSASRLVGFCLVWLALAVFTVESILQGRRAARLRAVPSET